MSPAVTFHRLAELELCEAAEYYESKSSGLGAALVTQVERCVAAIIAHPEAGTIIGGAIRRRVLHRFPYGVLYSHTPNEIRVLAIMNLRRRPNYWVGRV